MRFQSLATRLLFIVIGFAFTACGKSPWSDYVNENHLGPSPQGKPVVTCPLLDGNQIQWLQGPTVNVESSFQIAFVEKPDFNLKIDLFMPDMGHGSSPVQIEALDETHFLVKRVYFIMHGDWLVRIKDGDHVLCQFEVNLP